MAYGTYLKSVAGAAITAAGLLAAVPAHASLNDQYQCDREGEGSLIVEIQAFEPGIAVLYDRATPDAQPIRIRLTARANGDDGFRFSNGGTVFEGWGFDATLDYQRASFTCRMAIPNELIQEEPRIANSVVLLNDFLWIMGETEEADIFLRFGASEAEAVSALQPLLGTPMSQQGPDECPVGPLTFLVFEGLAFQFQDGELAGWTMEYGATPPVSIRLLGGAQLGDTEDRLPDWMRRMEATTLGIEQYGAGVHAVVREDSPRIGSLWAGAACVFR